MNMQRKIFLLMLAISSVAMSSCGLFKKDCGCPSFGQKPAHTKDNHASVVTDPGHTKCYGAVKS
jgi:hypothetical protein